MTHSEAFKAIQAALTRLKIKSIWGEQLNGNAAICVIHKMAPVELKNLEDSLEAGEISPLEYTSEMMLLIQRYKEKRFKPSLF